MATTILPDCHSPDGHLWPPSGESIGAIGRLSAEERRARLEASTRANVTCVRCGLEASRAAFAIDSIMRDPDGWPTTPTGGDRDE